ncbi:putative surface protein with fasciclin (FAS1) repeats [Tibeticola sediminis]|uniref:Putative surface protein with fasciclin (FAS1) repeats n=1 Tax=Tibeticola sediminis TaxID=1917811 RepID=A0A3N4UYY2_9BURK|nr:fasciclin domain-containing protein [Tibeticola sediminis]RPE66790.1 putative surface protein with fasciclin (FAS1) repeats [Tibeticola sediminis]
MDQADTSWFHAALPKRRFLQWSAAAVTLAALSACGGGDDDHPPDIVELAKSEADLSILVEAVVAAGLVDTLKGPGPFTVFAPTNAAFAALLGELGVTQEALLANKPLLTAVLTYHVVPGRVLKADVPINTAIRTAQGQTFSIDAMLRITDQRGRMASIVATDVFTSNGVIHVIDKVILPSA